MQLSPKFFIRMISSKYVEPLMKVFKPYENLIMLRIIKDSFAAFLSRIESFSGIVFVLFLREQMEWLDESKGNFITNICILRVNFF